MNESRTIEQQVADTILEKRKTITLDGKTYEIAPPTLATIIMISELVSLLPPSPSKSKKLDVLREVLSNARDTGVIGKIIAVLILGAKRVQENHMIQNHIPAPEMKPRWFWKPRQKHTTTYIPELDHVAELVLKELSPAQANEIVASTLIQLQIPDFFALTTSLTTTNQLKPTREVVREATASGE